MTLKEKLDYQWNLKGVSHPNYYCRWFETEKGVAVERGRKVQKERAPKRPKLTRKL